MIDIQSIRQRWNDVGSKLDERRRRLFAAGEVRAAGRGGLEAVAKITGYARSTLGRGLKQLDSAPFPAGRVRRQGGGRRPLASHDATLLGDLRRVVEPATLGDPMRPLLWVSKSYDKVAEALRRIVRGYEDKLQELVFESRELREYAEGAWESEELRRRALTEANAKLANIAARFDVLLKEASDSGRAIANAERMRVEVKDIQQAVFRRSVGG